MWHTAAIVAAVRHPNAPAECANPVLANAVTELGWSLTRLVAEVNTLLGTNYVSRSTASEWMNKGRVPHDPLPTVVAHLLSHELGRTISVQELWAGKAKDSPLWIPADTGLDVPWTVRGTLDILADWLVNGGNAMNLDRRTFLALSGAALTAPAWDYVDHLDSSQHHAVAQLPFSGDSNRQITPAMAQVVEGTIDHLRRVDDQEGGNINHLRFVHQQFMTVGQYVKSGQAANSKVMNQLLRSWSELGQFAAWMAVDAEEHGLANRYFHTALRAAHSVGDRALGAHILGFMVYQAAYCGQAREAIDLANAARDATSGTPTAVRSLIAARDAMAQASIGNTYGVQKAMEESRELMARPDAVDTRPSYLYWWTQKNVEHEAAFITLHMNEVRSRQQLKLFENVEETLKEFIQPDNITRQRDALYNSVRLSHAHLSQGAADKTVETGRYAIQGVRTLRHPRSITQLRKLRADINNNSALRYKTEIVDFRKELDSALAEVS